MNKMNHDNFYEKSGKNFVFITKTVFLTIYPRTNIIFHQIALDACLYAPLHCTTAVFCFWCRIKCMSSKRWLTVVPSTLALARAGRTNTKVTGKLFSASSVVELDSLIIFFLLINLPLDGIIDQNIPCP